MAQTDPSVIEKYQLALQKDPNSQAFAPLAEAYRELKLMKEAERVVRDGMKRHPNFVSGLVTLAKILRDLGRFAEALPPLKKAAQLAPENILAQQLMAEIYLGSRQPKEALRAFKMVLFLNPNSKTAQNAVNKLESLTADEYDDEVFQMSKLHHVKMDGSPEPYGTGSASSSHSFGAQSVLGSGEGSSNIPLSTTMTSGSGKGSSKAMERMLSLIDAFIVRNDLEKAHLLLRDTMVEFGDHSEIQRRMKSLQIRTTSEPETAQSLKPLASGTTAAPLLSRPQLAKEWKLKVLNELLSRIDGYRQSVEL